MNTYEQYRTEAYKTVTHYRTDITDHDKRHFENKTPTVFLLRDTGTFAYPMNMEEGDQFTHYEREFFLIDIKQAQELGRKAIYFDGEKIKTITINRAKRLAANPKPS